MLQIFAKFAWKLHSKMYVRKGYWRTMGVHIYEYKYKED